MAGSYVLDGVKWGSAAYGTGSGTIYWSFALYSWTGGYQFDAQISDATYRQLVRDAFSLWSTYANLNFVEITDSSSTMLRLGWDYIDGDYGTVGETRNWYNVTNTAVRSITRSEIRFDTSEDWSANKFYTGSAVNFFGTAVHEIGHALGLGHPNDTDEIMYYSSDDQSSLGSGDIAGIRAIYGANAASVFRATAQNDSFFATALNDVIDGLAGTDTVVFSGGRAGFTVTRSGAGLTVTGQGTDTLTNIERLAFTDGTLAFDTAGTAGMAYRLYQAAFDRTPDQSGLGYWIKAMDSGAASLNTVALQFIGSAEFTAKYGTPASVNNLQFLNLVYQNVLNRDADAAGSNYWLGQLNQGSYSRDKLLVAFSESAENQANVAAAISDGIWYV